VTSPKKICHPPCHRPCFIFYKYPGDLIFSGREIIFVTHPYSSLGYAKVTWGGKSDGDTGVHGALAGTLYKDFPVLFYSYVLMLMQYAYALLIAIAIAIVIAIAIAIAL